jgi:hypothetical protein
VGCGSFGEPSDRPTSAGADGTPTAALGESDPPPAPAPAQSAAPAASAFPSPPAPRDVVVFEDGFERNVSDVIGTWTTAYGNLELAPQPDGSRSFLARTYESTTHSLLVKRLDGVSRRVSVRAKISLKVAGGFEWASDYCAVLDVWLGGHVLASFYVNAAGDWKAWLHGPAGGGGNGSDFPGIALDDSNELELDVRWDEKQVTLASSVNGNERLAKPVTLLAASADAVPSIAVGPWCFGNKPPAITAEVDDVVVKTTE